MPNGGSDNCGECQFRFDRKSGQVECGIRGVRIDEPFWTYCANQTKHNPLGIEVPVGAVNVSAAGYPYRREAVAHSSVDVSPSDLLDLLRRLVAGELEDNSRVFQAALIGQVGDQAVAEAVPELAEIALAPPGGSDLVPDGYFHEETKALRVEYLRLAALKALRKIDQAHRHLPAATHLGSYRDSGAPDKLSRLDFTVRYVVDYQDPP